MAHHDLGQAQQGDLAVRVVSRFLPARTCSGRSWLCNGRGSTTAQASVRISESETLQWFCRLLKKPTIDFTLLEQGFCRD